ncbi:MAG: hypothetical protein KGJ78_16015 [Alphaproteobacteria bacterium]|nr:hypothetical protein [Alphaproteobacteria bacterium]
MTELSGGALRKVIADQITLNTNSLLATLAPYDAVQATTAWHTTLRAVEELINIPAFGLDTLEEARRLMAVPLGEEFLADPSALNWIVPMLSQRFDSALAQRFATVLYQSAALGAAYRAHGMADLGYGIHLGTIGDAITYFQSRRRLMVTLLYTLPRACKGSQPMTALDSINVFMPQIELHGMSLVTLHRQALLADIVPDFVERSDGAGGWGSHHYQPLESFFLEPERLSVLEMERLRPSTLPPIVAGDIDPKRIFSAAELRHQARLIGRAYQAFGLDDTRFAAASKLVFAVSRHVEDDYFVVLDHARFETLLRAQGATDTAQLRSELLADDVDFMRNSNSFAPFVVLGDKVVSNVNLLMRFLNAFKSFALESRKRYQIHSGFVFEDMVKRDLAELGFAVTDIKRINRKEFDVVATRGGAIYNIQCKNNWVDLRDIEADPTAFARYNRWLVWYYKRALAKEEAREQLLRDRLGLSEIRHFVVSRFPVITDDTRIVAYNRLAEGLGVVRPAGTGRA